MTINILFLVFNVLEKLVYSDPVYISVHLQVVATESEPPRHNETAPVNVTLLDENDNSPVFSSDTYEGKVFANQTEGMLLVQVSPEIICQVEKRKSALTGVDKAPGGFISHWL